MPQRSRSEWGERAGQALEQIGFRAGGGEGQAHATSGFDDAGGDLDQPQRRWLVERFSTSLRLTVFDQQVR